ncbi:MAG: hypothetical protein WA634_18110 [Silvibacterium sp.]
MDLRNLLLRAAFSAILAILSLIICRVRIPQKLADIESRRFDLLFLIVFAASHFLLFYTTFFLLHQKPHADLPGYYVPQAHSVMKGLVPYRNFQSSYAPLNSYLNALLLCIRDSPLSILTFQILCDIASIPFWIGFLRRFLPETTLRRSALLYLIQPIVLWGTCIDGKNHACISLLLAVALYTVARREIVSGFSYSLSFVLVKILPLIFLPALFIGSHKRAKWLLSAVTLPVLVYGGFLVHGIDVTVPLRVEGSLRTPANLPYFVALFSGYTLPARLLDGLSLFATGVAVLIAARAQIRTHSKPRSFWKLSISILFVLFTVLIFTKKSDPIYLTMCFFLLSAFTAVQVEGPSRWVAYPYALLSFLGLPIASFWFFPLHTASGIQLHALLLAGDRNAFIMAIAQILLLSSYALFLMKIFRELQDSSHSARLLQSDAAAPAPPVRI